MTVQLELRLFGAFVARWSDGAELSLPGAKQRAIVALLATSPYMMRSRSWLQMMLWGGSDQRKGGASLRQALSGLRRAAGPRADTLLKLDGDRVSLNASIVVLSGGQDYGSFLDGIDIDEEAFEGWLRNMRASEVERDTPGTLLRTSVNPRVAVLPLIAFPPEGDHAFLGDVISQDIIRALSRSQFVDVISHLSSRTIDPHSVQLEDVSGILGSDYLITGKILSDKQTLAIDIDFHEVAGGRMLWSEKFSISMGEVFSGDQGVIRDIAREIIRVLLNRSVQMGAARPMPDVPAHALLMSAISLMHNMSKASFARSLEHLNEVIRRAPQHSIPRAWRAEWYLLKVSQGWSDNPAGDHEMAMAETRSALDLNPNCAFSLAIYGNVLTVLTGDFETAKQIFSQSLDLNPSSAFGCNVSGILYSFTGDGREAVRRAERAQLLSPCDPRTPFFEGISAAAYLTDGQYDRAIDLASKSLAKNPRHVSALRAKVVGLSMAGRGAEAGQAAQELLQREPNLTVKGYLARHPAAATRVGRDWAHALGQAGVPLG